MIVDLTWERSIHVATHMRADDFREVMANRWDNDPYSFAAECMRYPGPKLACVDAEGVPVAIGGIAVHLPGVGQAWLVGTEAIGKQGVEMAHTCRQLIDRLLASNDLHRVQAFSADFHTGAHRWLRAIGFEKESVMRAYGKTGGDFFVFSIVKGS